MHNRMGGKDEQSGFTIVETLIVLAVTGALLASALALVSGRQDKTQFQIGIQQTQQQVQQVINETSNGYFPANGSLTCQANVGNPPTLATGSSEQGTNAGCIFLGKFIQFKVRGTDPEQFSIDPVVGNLRGSDGSLSQDGDLYDASEGPFPILAMAGNNRNPSLTGLNELRPLNGGITTVWMKYREHGSDPLIPTGTVGFLSDYTRAFAVGESDAAGAQRLKLYTIKNTTINQTTSVVADCAYPGECLSETRPMLAVNEVQICFASGGTDQSGLLTIGGDGDTTTALEILPGRSC